MLIAITIGASFSCVKSKHPIVKDTVLKMSPSPPQLRTLCIKISITPGLKTLCIGMGGFRAFFTTRVSSIPGYLAQLPKGAGREF